MNGVSIIILSFNGEDTLPATLSAAVQVSDDIHVVDSYSRDCSQEIARQHGAQVVEHPFENYGVQRKWASDNLPLKYDWELHLDQDDFMTDELIDEINRTKENFPSNVTGYYIGRLIHFLGRPIRHGGMYPSWQMRLFRKGTGQCDKRRYDSHFYVSGPTSHLKGQMIDNIRMTLSEWTARHNRWADAEAEELETPTSEGVIAGKLTGDVVQRNRALRRVYETFPLLVRPFIMFFYRYVLRAGFLDGKTGLIFYILQTFWWRFLVDAKLIEHSIESGVKNVGIIGRLKQKRRDFIVNKEIARFKRMQAKLAAKSNKEIQQLNEKYNLSILPDRPSNPQRGGR